jgi:hypothetical protein
MNQAHVSIVITVSIFAVIDERASGARSQPAE